MVGVVSIVASKSKNIRPARVDVDLHPRPMTNRDETTKAILIPRSQVQAVTTLLKEHGVFDSHRKIQPQTGVGANSQHSEEEVTFAIPVSISRATDEAPALPLEVINALADINIPITFTDLCVNKKSSAATVTLYNAAQDFLSLHHLQRDPSSLLSTLPKRWSIYPPLVLLPHSSFSSSEWIEYLSSLPVDLRALFFAQITSALKATHLAINAPIKSTAIRSPRIIPLHGDFGSLVPDSPTLSDFNNAFWATAVQNGITQTWAPMYTMFSRGNITEKARVLNFPDVKGEEIADLFVGIGYFAFSYLKAGAKRVWGWDLNAWSIEGLRRGAELNGWTCVVNPDARHDARLVVYNEDNKTCSDTLRKFGARVKHVNLGLLPSSQLAWRTAAEILDPKGGWIHVHGNCEDSEIDRWKGNVVREFNNIFGSSWKVDIANQFRVKEFGPRIGHWVLDLACSPV